MKTYYRSAVALLGMIAVLSFGACADDEIVDNRQGVKDGLGFSVSDIQDAPEDQTRTLNDNPEDYAVQSIDFTEEAGNACLQETTVPGVNPVKRAPATRSDFQNSIGAPFGAFACKNGSGKPDFFYNEKVAANGTMVSPKVWTSDESTLQFYAVYPYIDGSNPNLQLVQPLAGELPSVDFTTPTDIANQIDLMTASTQDITYTSTGGGSHVVPLTFYHSLTAIRFGVGSNLSWAKTIKSVEFQGVYSKGRYDIKTKTWSNQSTAQNYKLDNIGVSTSEAVNNVILKDGNTFLMVPQTLPTGAKIVVTFSDNTSVTAKIEGKKWKPGTTKTYMITEKNSNWNYIIQTTNPTAAAYNATQTGTYGISSYRQAPDGTKRPVAWKVVGYDNNNDGTFSMAEKPVWVTGLTKTEGNGSIATETGIATVTKADLIDLLAKRNKELKEATALGSAGAPYDLSTKGGSVNRITANCYVISAPGHYRIPLVYGNAIENGLTNVNSYISHAPTGTPNEQYVLRNFKDHAGNNIDNPWIEKTNGGANASVNGAEVVWADAADLVRPSSLSIKHVGNEAFLDFEVKESDIQSGNAVVAVKKGGTTVWSWHLWFAPKDALDKIKVTNHQNKDYYFTKETLGWKPTQWSGSTYNKARTVKVKVEQTVANNNTRQVAIINITQNNGDKREGIATLYQFGRKDAFPGTNTFYPTNSYSFDNTPGGRSLGYAIQHPENMFIAAGTGTYYWDWCNATYCNLWSADNTTTGWNDNAVVKTVYDPCPVGFKMPASNAFTGFTSNGQYQSGAANINANGTTDSSDKFFAAYGHNFYTNSSKNATIFFPTSGIRTYGSGSLLYVGYYGYYWSAVPGGTFDSCDLGFNFNYVAPQEKSSRSCGYAARPVAE